MILFLLFGFVHINQTVNDIKPADVVFYISCSSPFFSCLRMLDVNIVDIIYGFLFIVL